MIKTMKYTCAIQRKEYDVCSSCLQMKQFIFLFFMLVAGTMLPAKAQLATPTGTIDVPVGGNTWQLNHDVENIDQITPEGIARWTRVDQYFGTYIRLAKRGTLRLWLNATVANRSNLVVRIGGIKKEIALESGNKKPLYLGEWPIRDSGYVAIEWGAKQYVDLRHITSFGIAGSAIDEHVHFVKSNEGNFFYWGRRGPSTHLNYQIPTDNDIAYYYNEITVPVGSDIIGSYFMANGFSGGYFGMQVNAANERRILFSVWSPFQTDNPKEIPEDHRIKLLKKGHGVYGGEFGGEGSGGQSYLKFNWKAGNTYKFLLKGEPVANNYTNYTAWFFAPEVNRWELIASFSRPQTHSWLKGFHSFLENFSPKQGIYEREVYFGNQWVVDKRGEWHEVRKAKFSADNTARVGYRMDYSGGSKNEKFYLHNFGFFDRYTPIGSVFERSTKNKKPSIDFDQLP